MKENTQKVVKCAPCDKYFGYAEDNKNCPFCHTEYSEITEMADAGETAELETKDLHEGGQGKKEASKTQKKSFKMWKDA